MEKVISNYILPVWKSNKLGIVFDCQKGIKPNQMKFLNISILLFTTLICNAQNFHQGIILDQDVKEPLEFVNVFNSEDNTISNADGQYAFSSSKDSII